MLVKESTHDVKTTVAGEGQMSESLTRLSDVHQQGRS